MFDDFNNLPDNVVRKIFSHLSYEDLFLQASLVSKNWYDYIGRSHSINKVRLKIEGWHNLEIINDHLTCHSSRIYNSLTFYNLNAEKKFPYLMCRKWKDVRLTQMKFMSAQRLYEYIKQFGEDIESLDIERIVIIMGDENCRSTLSLPKLKHLKLQSVPTATFQIFERCASVRSLHFDIPAFGSKKRTDITNFFENFRFAKMETLVICRNSLYGLPIENHHIIEEIIISMKTTLKTIELRNWGYCHTLEEIWNDVQAERISLNICSHAPLTKNLRSLLPNTFIKSFKLSLLIIPEIQWFRRFFLLVPNLEELSLSLIRKEILYMAACYLHQLKLLKYKSCIIELACSDDEDEEEHDENEDPGPIYNFIGPKEIFELNTVDNDERPMVKHFVDEQLSVDFGNKYYRELKNRDSNVNQKIIIVKTQENWT